MINQYEFFGKRTYTWKANMFDLARSTSTWLEHILMSEVDGRQEQCHTDLDCVDWSQCSACDPVGISFGMNVTSTRIVCAFVLVMGEGAG